MRDYNNFDGLFSSITFSTNQDMNGIEISNVVLAGSIKNSSVFDDLTRKDLCWPIGDGLIQSDDAEEFTATDTWEKFKQMTLSGCANLRIKFDLKCSDASGIGYGRIYKNGVAVGTERQDDDDTYTTYSEDFSNCKDGDTIELWIKSDGTNSTYIRNFRAYVAATTAPSLTVDAV